MKKQLIIGALFLAAILLVNTSANAQTAAPASTTANVTITLGDVISFTGSEIVPIGFDYSTAAKYGVDQTSSDKTKLVITSTQPYSLTVKSNGSQFIRATAGTTADNINVGVLSVVATSTTSGGVIAPPVTLSTTPQALITAAPLGAAKQTMIEYTIPGTASNSTAILGKKADTYSQAITFTATAP